MTAIMPKIYINKYNLINENDASYDDQCRINHGAGGAPAPGPSSLGGLKILQILHASQLLAKPNIVIFQKLGHTKFCYNFLLIYLLLLLLRILCSKLSVFLQLLCVLSNLSVTVSVVN